MSTFDYYSGLQYRVKTQERIIREFQSGERYLRLREKLEAVIREQEQEREIRKLKKELAQARREIAHVRRLWLESEDDLDNIEVKIY